MSIHYCRRHGEWSSQGCSLLDLIHISLFFSNSRQVHRCYESPAAVGVTNNVCEQPQMRLCLTSNWRAMLSHLGCPGRPLTDRWGCVWPGTGGQCFLVLAVQADLSQTVGGSELAWLRTRRPGPLTSSWVEGRNGSKLLRQGLYLPEDFLYTRLHDVAFFSCSVVHQMEQGIHRHVSRNTGEKTNNTVAPDSIVFACINLGTCWHDVIGSGIESVCFVSTRGAS